MSAGEPPQRAIALRYDPQEGAPRVVAKGQGLIAAAIVAKAREAGVVIEANPLLADALAGVELDAEIPVELYAAVAQIIAYVLRIGGAARGRE